VNPNPHEVTLQKIRFALVHEQDTLITGWNPEKRVLAPGDSQALRATLQLPHAAFKRLPNDIWTDPDARFELIGDAFLDTWVGEMRFPGAFHQVIHVNMPQQMARYRDLM